MKKVLLDFYEVSGWVSLMLIGLGLVMLLFSLWQLDLLFVSRMWGPAETNVAFYSDLIGNGYGSYSEMPWTINIWLFPSMTAGLAYDVLMILNGASWFVTASGIYVLMRRLKTIFIE